MDAILTGALIGAGGGIIVALAGFWAKARNISAATAPSRGGVEAAPRAVGFIERGQVAYLYSKALEQLGSDRLDTRMGGIYALERLARDSPQDHPTIMEVLAAFIREHSREQWPLAECGATPLERATRPDVQAAAIVIGRRIMHDDSEPINLEAAIFTRANLYGADLAGANLIGADLTGANLNHACLIAAYLIGADLSSARLTGADLNDARLTGADLTSARLTGADLFGADLTGANLTDADLTGAIPPSDAVVPEGWQRNPRSGRLTRAP